MGDEAEMPPAVVYSGSEVEFEIRLQNRRSIASVIGEDVLAIFYKCFVGLDRMTTFEHLIYINHAITKVDPPDPTITKHATDRNLSLLFFMMAGTLYEFGAALDQLAKTKVVLGLRDRKAWEPVNDFRKRWNTNPYASKVRNGFSHHLGDVGAIRAGIGRAPESSVLYVGGRLRHSGRFHAPWDAVFSGEEIVDEAIKPFIEKAYEDHTEIQDQFLHLFQEVLISNNIPFRRAPRSG